MKSESSGQTFIRQTDKQTLAFLELLTEPKRIFYMAVLVGKIFFLWKHCEWEYAILEILVEILCKSGQGFTLLTAGLVLN